MVKTMRARPAWLFRRCRIGNDFPTVLHAEGHLRERERENSRVFGFLRWPLRHGFSASLRAADLHQRCIGPCSCFSSLPSDSRCLPLHPGSDSGLGQCTDGRDMRIRGGDIDTAKLCARSHRQDRGRQKKARIFSFVFARVVVVMGVGRMATLFTPCGWELGRE